jgi:diacylglycerol kinase family enzyme
MVVLGAPPDRLTAWSRRRRVRVEIDGAEVWSGAATSVIAASGEYLRGADLVPRGHPGDGRFEVQVFALAPSQRRQMRRRLPAGTHLPHPEIKTFSARSLVVSFRAPVRAEIDGERLPRTRTFRVRLVPHAATVVF